MRTTYKTSQEADGLIERIRAAHPLTVVSVADAINYALRYVAAHDPEIEEAREMEEKRIAELAEGVYSAVYGDIDHRQFHTNRVNEIVDWLTDGEPLEGDETVEELVKQWRRDHIGDGDIVESLGASNWIQVELEYGANSLHEIEASIDNMFPNEEGNDELAAAIYSMM